MSSSIRGWEKRCWSYSGLRVNVDRVAEETAYDRDGRFPAVLSVDELLGAGLTVHLAASICFYGRPDLRADVDRGIAAAEI